MNDSYLRFISSEESLIKINRNQLFSSPILNRFLANCFDWAYIGSKKKKFVTLCCMLKRSKSLTHSESSNKSATVSHTDYCSTNRTKIFFSSLQQTVLCNRAHRTHYIHRTAIQNCLNTGSAKQVPPTLATYVCAQCARECVWMLVRLAIFFFLCSLLRFCFIRKVYFCVIGLCFTTIFFLLILMFGICRIHNVCIYVL